MKGGVDEWKGGGGGVKTPQDPSWLYMPLHFKASLKSAKNGIKIKAIFNNIIENDDTIP